MRIGRCDGGRQDVFSRLRYYFHAGVLQKREDKGQAEWRGPFVGFVGFCLRDGSSSGTVTAMSHARKYLAGALLTQ